MKEYVYPTEFYVVVAKSLLLLRGIYSLLLDFSLKLDH